jgi:hypothetical protein
MKHLISLLLLTVGAVAPAQVKPTAKAAQSAATMGRIQKIDVLIQVLPLNLKKPQIEALLVQMEKAIEKDREIRTLEDQDLEKLEPKVTDALKDGLDKGVYPPRELQQEVAKLTRAMAIRRQVAMGEMVDAFYAGIDKVMEPGQRTVMAKSLEAALLEPNVKASLVTEEQKIKFFIRKVFLDVAAYQVLLDLSKTIKE